MQYMQATSNPHIYYKFFIMKTTAVFSYRSLLSRDRGLIRVGLYIKLQVELCPVNLLYYKKQSDTLLSQKYASATLL